LNLRSRLSVAASTTSRAPAAGREVGAGAQARERGVAAGGVDRALLTCRSMFCSIFWRPRASAASLTSSMATSKPLCAKTWAMPFPICPAPTTATWRVAAVAAGCAATRLTRGGDRHGVGSG
jgi:hypothetical protein